MKECGFCITHGEFTKCPECATEERQTDLAQTKKQRNDLLEVAKMQNDLLDVISIQLFKWAAESRTGGYSTHQVAPQTKLGLQVTVSALAHKTTIKAAEEGRG